MPGSDNLFMQRQMTSLESLQKLNEADANRDVDAANVNVAEEKPAEEEPIKSLEEEGYIFKQHIAQQRKSL